MPGVFTLLLSRDTPVVSGSGGEQNSLVVGANTVLALGGG